MANWRIEQAKTDRASCRHCGHAIAKGEYRFGNDGRYNTAWYHLPCAATGKPRAFKPFAERAAELSAAAPAKPPQAPERPTPADGNGAELLARLVANPDDDTTRAVYVDWLQTQNDPLGDYLALVRAGNAAAAKKVFRQHHAAFIGGLAPRLFAWRDGFIDGVNLQLVAHGAEPDVLADVIGRILALPAAALLRKIRIPHRLDASLVGLLSARLPPTVRSMYASFTNELGNLAVPGLERLELFGAGWEPVDAAALAPLFGGGNLPRLRVLSIVFKRISLQLATALIDSPLLRRLEFLELGLETEAEALVSARRDAFAHVRAIGIRRFDGSLMADVFPEQTAAWRARGDADDD